MSRVSAFQGGQLSSYYSEWAKLTSDTSILETVLGEKIDFIVTPTASSYPPNSICKEHSLLADAEIKSLLEKRVIIECTHEEGEFISPVFAVPKNDGSVRLILNLKRLNQFIANYHFKMESIQTIMKLVTKNCWMATLDLKDPAYQKYLKFFYKGKLYKYLALPNGLATCPRKFTKLMKPPLAKLREMHHVISGYIDDFYLQGHTYVRCARNVLDTVKTFDSLGLVIHPEKSVTSPSQEVIILGFVINSITMTIRVTDEKKAKIKTILLAAIANPVDISIRQVAKIIGSLVSSLPGVQYGALYYRCLEMDKISALKISKGNFHAPMTISKEGLEELGWWVDHIDESFNYLSFPPFNIIIYSDASLQGWGAVLGETSSGGRWSPAESTQHINYLELLAALFALRLFHSTIQGKHVKLMIDNTTAVAVINNMGTCHSRDCHSVARQIWQFCANNNIWLTAAHIPGSQNVLADRESRHFQSQDKEWKLNSISLQNALDALKFQPEIDLFASRLNTQFALYCSYRPDPEATFVDAFSTSWADLKFYCFPPFSCLLQAVKKVIQIQFDSGLSYSSINSARCALSTILQLSDSEVTFGQLPIVKRFMKGVFELRPALPRYQTTWDVKKVLDFFRSSLCLPR